MKAKLRNATTVKVPADLVARVDGFRTQQKIAPPFSDALRYLVDLGIKADAAAGKGNG
jgi:hypothetical protein